MDVLAVQAPVPIREERSSTHALLMRDKVNCRGTIGLTLFLNVDDLLAWRDRRGDIRHANAINIGFFGGLARKQRAIERV